MKERKKLKYKPTLGKIIKGRIWKFRENLRYKIRNYLGIYTIDSTILKSSNFIYDTGKQLSIMKEVIDSRILNVQMYVRNEIYYREQIEILLTYIDTDKKSEVFKILNDIHNRRWQSFEEYESNFTTKGIEGKKE